MQTKDLVSTLKKFDAYPKTLEDFRIKTFGGAAGTLTCSGFQSTVALMRFISDKARSCVFNAV